MTRRNSAKIRLHLLEVVLIMLLHEPAMAAHTVDAIAPGATVPALLAPIASIPKSSEIATTSDDSEYLLRLLMGLARVLCENQKWKTWFGNDHV